MSEQVPRYELRDRGVFDLELGEAVQRGNARWPEYEAWLRDGGVPAPRPAAQPAPLEDRRRETCARVNGIRSASLRSAIVEMDGHPYQADSASAARLGLILAVLAHRAPDGFEILWRDADNVGVPLTKEGLVRLGELMCGSITTMFERSFELKDGVIASSEAPDAIDLEAAWNAAP